MSPYSDSSDGPVLAGAGAGVLLRAPRVLAPLAGARLAAARPRGAAAFFGAAARLPAAFALRFGAAFFAAGFMAAARFGVFLAAARFGAAFFAAFRAGFFATFPAFAAAGFLADFRHLRHGFFAVFLAAIGNPPAFAPARTADIAEGPLRYSFLTGEATDVARRILPRMVMVKENLAGPKPMYPVCSRQTGPQALCEGRNVGAGRAVIATRPNRTIYFR